MEVGRIAYLDVAIAVRFARVQDNHITRNLVAVFNVL